MELDAEHRQKNEESEMEMLRLGEEKSKWICKSIARGQSKWIGRCVFEVRHMPFPYIECAYGV